MKLSKAYWRNFGKEGIPMSIAPPVGTKRAAKKAAEVARAGRNLEKRKAIMKKRGGGGF